MPLKELKNPQGKALSNIMSNIGIPEITDIQIGKHFTIVIEALSATEANTKVDEVCSRLLANKTIETYAFQLQEL